MTASSRPYNLDGAQLEEMAGLGIQIRHAIPLAHLTTMKVGGAAEYFATVTELDQLIALVRWAQNIQLPYFILGGGSNILISDQGIRGLVIYNRCRQVEIKPASEAGHTLLWAESGAAMAGVARTSVRAALVGLEWGISVPGTIGGAVVGNAGAHGGEVKDNLHCALLLDTQGNLIEYGLDDFAYRYRASTLKQLPEETNQSWQPLQAGLRPVVLHATFALTPDDASTTAPTVSERADEFLAHRRRTQPVEPLIEEAGLKGFGIGGAEISQTHANFIINPGGSARNSERESATTSDIIELITHVQNTIVERFGVMLTPEVQLAE